jgi:hypothetical protein
MKNIILVLMVMVLLLGVAWAGEKEELALKWRALVAEYQLAEIRFNQVKQEVNDFAVMLDAKGLMIGQGNVVIEKPKEPAKDIPKPIPSKEVPKK